MKRCGVISIDKGIHTDSRGPQGVAGQWRELELSQEKNVKRK